MTRVWLIALSLLLFLSSGATIAQAEIQQKMDQAFLAFRDLFALTAKGDRMTGEGVDKQKLLDLINKLRDTFHSHEVSGSNLRTDPGFAITLQVLKSTLDDARLRLEEGRVGYALWRVRSVPEYCISCHARDRSFSDFQTTMTPPDGLSPLETGRFLMATRQFEAAAQQFLKVATDPSQKLTRMEALRSWLVINTRIRPDPTDALSTLVKIRSTVALAPVEDEEAKGWLKSLRRWKAESETVPVDTLRKAEALIAQGLSMQDDTLEGRGTVELLRATGLLHHMLEQEKVSPSERTHALYLLGRSYLSLPDIFAYELPDIFLRQCIRGAPGSRDAKKCYRLLSEHIIVGYSGSGGTRVPADVKLELQELYRRAYNVPEYPSST